MSISPPTDDKNERAKAPADPAGTEGAAAAGEGETASAGAAPVNAQPLPASIEQLFDEINESMLELMWRFRQQADQACAPYGLNPLRSFILILLQRDTLHPKTLAQILDLAPPAVSHLLRELEERGLIERRSDENDRRRLKLELTAKGARTAAELRTTWCRMGAERLKVLSEDEIRTLLTIQRKLLAEPQQ